MLKDIKTEFGRLMRLSRDAKGLSRAALAMRLGISSKTIQSWEMGRTFIERLDLIPRLEAELECSLSNLIARATGAAPAPRKAYPGAESSRAESAEDEYEPGGYGGGSPQRNLTRPGPLAPRFTIVNTSAAGGREPDALEGEWTAVPMIRPAAALGRISDLAPKDIIRHVLVPGEWVPRAGLLVAVRMGDSAMMPMIPLGATVILDLRPIQLCKALGKVCALDYAGKGLRIRRVVRDMDGETFCGAGVIEHGRARLPIRPGKGDRLLGYVVGMQAAVT